MSNRPTSRPSTLAGQSPVRPRNRPESDVQPTQVPRTLPSTQSAAEVMQQPSSTPSTAPGKPEKTKVGFYMRPEDMQRAQRAHTTTIIHTGLRSWTAFVNEAVMAYTKQLEQQHNDSRPF